MAILKNFFVIALGALIYSIMMAQGYRIWRIVGGNDANANQFPYQVSLRYKGRHVCGGSVITNNYILTATHCLGFTNDTNGKFQLHDPKDFSIRAGSIDRFTGGVIVKCAEFKAHEKYGNFLYDVAVIRLQEPLIYSRNISPLPLATSPVPVNATVQVAGWGRLEQGGFLPRYLQWTNFTIISDQDCKSIVPHYNDGIICLNHTRATGSCQGDSGGAAIYKNEIVGISNYIIPYCAYNKPDAYAKVFYFRDWIIQHSDLQK